MIWDKLFWLWFIAAAFYFMAYGSVMHPETQIMLGLLLLGIGILKFADEDKKHGIRKKILEKLRK
jgi:hypothetical protein